MGEEALDNYSSMSRREHLPHPYSKNKLTYSLSDIYAVIVLYKIKLEDSVTFLTLNESVKTITAAGHDLKLLVYDNSPLKQENQTLIFKGWDIVYHHDSHNSGVSAAYNLGAKYAKKNNKPWLMVLDQDTEFPNDALHIYINALNEKKGYNLFCPVLISANEIISPCKFKFFRGKSSKVIPETGSFDLKSLKPINSGLLISLSAFEEVGGYNHNIPLDFSDFEFMMRYGKMHPKGMILPLICQHGLSAHHQKDLQLSLNRFTYYIRGGRVLKQNFFSGLNIELLLFLRAIKLGLNYRTSAFLKVLFR